MRNLNSAVNEKSKLKELQNNETNIEWPLSIKKYQIMKQLGPDATVFLANVKYETLTKECVVKKLSVEQIQNETNLNKLLNEVTIMRQLRHENIITYYTSFCDTNAIYIVMELCQRGSLTDVITSYRNSRDIKLGVFNVYVIGTIMKDVLNGLNYIHNNGLIHRDIKAQNLLVDDKGFIQIADFGVSTDISNGRAITLTGTPVYLAPEVLLDTGYDSKIDIWSLGITCIVLATGNVPHYNLSFTQVLSLIRNGKPPTIESMETFTGQYRKYGVKYREFLRNCLQKDPRNRKTAAELLEGLFIKNRVKERKYMIKYLDVGKSTITKPVAINEIIEIENKVTKNVPLSFNFDIDYDETTLKKGLKKFKSDEKMPVNSKPVVKGRKYKIILKTSNSMGETNYLETEFEFDSEKHKIFLLVNSLSERKIIQSDDISVVGFHLMMMTESNVNQTKIITLKSVPDILKVQDKLHGYMKVTVKKIE